MKVLYTLLFFIIFSSSCSKKEINMPSSNQPPVVTPTYTYLALGDSYTIGEMVAPAENFPNQVNTLIKSSKPGFQSPKIIARTGWTTDELDRAIITAKSTGQLSETYDFVSLLIGVNNQYRGRSVDSYKPEFENLLSKAIQFAGNRPDRVVVLSIPDWGVTPFANGRDRAQIAREIDAYNAANRQIAQDKNVHYIDITPWTREAATDNSLLATDGLHPSGKEYARWAERIAAYFKSKI